MNPTAPTAPELATESPEDLAAGPVCVMCFNASDTTGAGGLSGDIATVAAMGGHALPVVTTILMRDTAEVFDQSTIEPDTIVEQARSVLEDLTIAGWKVGFLGSAEAVGAVAEVLSDYPDVPLVTYVPSLSWLDDDDAAQSYHDSLRELVLPQTEVLVGNHKTLTDFLLPEWDSERPPSARELAVAAGEHGTRYVLVTGMQLPNNFIDNVLASPQGAITGEKFERFDAAFVGAGDTLSASLATLLATGQELHIAVSEGLAFLDQALDAGFRPGMGQVVPDRFFWAVPPDDEDEDALDGEAASTDANSPPTPRNIH
ncbi:MAG: hydroxymethylpyrimidine/phosphomethylpyrimidine kinase [Leptothrix sp. (in: b-proteobacteria)]